MVDFIMAMKVHMMDCPVLRFGEKLQIKIIDNAEVGIGMEVVLDIVNCQLQKNGCITIPNVLC